MEMKKCLLIEDSDEAISTIKLYVSELPLFTMEVIKSYKKARETLMLYRTNFDLIILNIKLSEENILDLFSVFNDLPPTIITSYSSEYACLTYDIDIIVDYLSKPFPFNRFLRAINRALRVKISTNSFINNHNAFLKVGRKIQRFNLNEVDFIEAYGQYCKIHFQGNITVVNEVISTLEKKLANQNFLRVHKSYLINLKMLSGFDHKYLFINKEKLLIGISYKDKVSALLMLLDTDKEMD